MALSEIYLAEIEIKGTTPILFHAWNVEETEKKSAAKKGSSEKKDPSLESLVYRNEKGEICIPGDYFRAALVDTARYFSDPRSPRKSSRDLFKQSIITETLLAPIGPGSRKTWDDVDKRRVVIQKAAITRQRPRFKEGWTAKFKIRIILPEYISIEYLHEVSEKAGSINGLADFRPTFGRFVVMSCKKI